MGRPGAGRVEAAGPDVDGVGFEPARRDARLPQRPQPGRALAGVGMDQVRIAGVGLGDPHAGVGQGRPRALQVGLIVGEGVAQHATDAGEAVVAHAAGDLGRHLAQIGRHQSHYARAHPPPPFRCPLLPGCRRDGRSARVGILAPAGGPRQVARECNESGSCFVNCTSGGAGDLFAGAFELSARGLAA